MLCTYFTIFGEQLERLERAGEMALFTRNSHDPRESVLAEADGGNRGVQPRAFD